MRPAVPLVALLALNLALHYGLPEPRSSRSAERALLFSARAEFDDEPGDVALQPEGWYGSEWDRHRNYSWTSGRKARLTFPPLRPGRYLAAFAVAHQVLPRDPERFGLLVNGRRVPLEHSVLPELTLLRGEVPADALPPGRPVRVVLLGPPPVSPRFLGKSGRDDRLLGAGIDWVALTPMPSAQHVDFVRSLFGHGWAAPEAGGRRPAGPTASFSVPSPGPQARLLLQADGALRLRHEGREVPLQRNAGLLVGHVSSPDPVLRFEVEGDARLDHAWLFDPHHVRGDAESLPALGPAWTPAGADPLGRPLRRLLGSEAPLRIGDGTPEKADLTVALLTRNNPHFPLHLPTHLIPRAQVRLAVGPVELTPTPGDLDTLFRGEVHLGARDLDLRVLEGDRPAFSWLELVSGDAR